MADIAVSVARPAQEVGLSALQRLPAEIAVSPGPRPDLSAPVSVVRPVVRVEVKPEEGFVTDLALLYQVSKL